MSASTLLAPVLAVLLVSWVTSAPPLSTGPEFLTMPSAIATLNLADNDVVPPGLEVSAVPCKPRDTLVPLPLNTSMETVFQPDVAVVRRCGGYCGIAVKCVPTKTRMVKRRVKEFNLFDKSSKIRSFKLEQHESCKCGCKVTASQCTPEQRFEPKRCKCVCKSPRQECKPPHVWHHDTCACTCPPGIASCSTGSVFDLEQCRCTSKRKKKRA